MRVSKKSTASPNASNNGSGPRPPAPGPFGGQPSAVSGPSSMFTSLRGGMQELVEALAAQLQGDLRLGSRVIGLRRLSPGFEVTLDSSGTLQTDAVVMATPAFIAAGLLEPIEPRLAALLRQIRYVSTATVSLGYRRADLPTDLNGFGFMVPKSENRQILACTWSSTKFDHRAPADGALLRLFVGGDTKEHLVETLGDEELFALAQTELKAIMGITAPPVAQRIFRWPKGNAQYDVGHLDRVAEMEQLAAAIPGLYLTGSAFRGIGLPDCIKSALATVEGLLLQVKTFER